MASYLFLGSAKGRPGFRSVKPDRSTAASALHPAATQHRPHDSVLPDPFSPTRAGFRLHSAQKLKNAPPPIPTLNGRHEAIDRSLLQEGGPWVHTKRVKSENYNRVSVNAKRLRASVKNQGPRYTIAAASHVAISTTKQKEKRVSRWKIFIDRYWCSDSAQCIVMRRIEARH